MKSSRLRRVVMTLFVFPFLVVLTHAQSTAPARATHGPAAAEVWALEDAYWRYVQAGDVDWYLSLWHDKFIGWPCGSEHPGDKSNIGDWVKRIRDEKVRYRYAVTQEATVEFRDVIVVYYQTPMVSMYPDGRVEGQATAATSLGRLPTRGRARPAVGRSSGACALPSRRLNERTHLIVLT